MNLFSANPFTSVEELIAKAARESWEELDLAGMGIRELPSSIGQCKSLKKLILGKSQPKRTWWTLFILEHEYETEEVGNPLETLPSELANLVNLKDLQIPYNNISEIPEVITNLTNLQTLDLYFNNISEIPDAIKGLINLQSLSLHNNKISEIPDAIRGLTNLQSLSLGYNKISEIPDAIRGLTNLQSLSLGYNKISEIPDAIRGLTNLQSLSLHDNNISGIPDAIRELTNLQSLSLHDNNISGIPDAIRGLTNLRFLSLGKNNISEIPDAVSELTNLQSLGLSSNNISVLPQSITKLTKISSSSIYSGFNLYGNPISNPPMEIVNKGMDAIREYFQQLESEGGEYLYEAKLLIIGEGGAGKTSLANKIINPNYKLCEEDSTKGIEVLHWSFCREDGNQITINIWDFGGQEIYHSTHQFFLSKRSLYVLVADNRKEDTDFYYWLNVVELLSDNSPILIVKNEKQDRKREINVNQLRDEFDNLKDVLETNLANNRNLEAIVTACKYHLSQLPHIGQTLPKTWVRVRRILESDPRNFITLETYLQICEDNGFKERKDKLQLSDYLHDLGICLHFQDDETSSLYKTVILKPKWGTDAAYAVLDNSRVILNHGHFTRQDLATIWSADEYEGMYGELLELMKKFQLCYEIPQAKGSYIAPQLLTETQPEYTWDDTENLILRYTYDFMPKGIIRQFIVTMHEDIEKNQEDKQIVWRSGVIINSKNIINTRAEVIENYGKREIKIRVFGKNKRDLLTTVTYELDKIHNSYKRLKDKYQKLIPCNCSTCKGSQDPHFYKLTDLKRRYEKRVTTVQCEISYDNVDVLGLIDDIASRTQPQNSTKNLDPEDDPKERFNFNFNFNMENNQHNPSIQISSQEQTMSDSQNTLNFHNSVGQFIMGDQNVAGDNIGIQNNNYSPNLAQAAKEIKELLDQLSEEYNPNTEKGQNLIKDEAVNAIKKDSTLQQKIVNALKEGSVTTLEEAINHPVAKVVIATVKGFLEG
ncbi:GTP-binding protein [Pseudanabaena sp. UWO311]|uniref:COR domain-containing protein n=1 Tax=Pseudanabaena sp. UWO311 TaxID=2487337 RepID=UPI00115791F9|nr:COR domain-containing protein [Pseudanabaena sp. UWO311]TYQ23664.1 GTP-binding protein [Pseudanabaena sp. UWO311]